MNTAQQKTLCKGFSIVRFDYENELRLETEYAITESGTVYQSKEKPYSLEFDSKDWMKTDLTLDDVKGLGAEYIGNYKVSI